LKILSTRNLFCWKFTVSVGKLQLLLRLLLTNEAADHEWTAERDKQENKSLTEFFINTDSFRNGPNMSFSDTKGNSLRFFATLIILLVDQPVVNDN